MEGGPDKGTRLEPQEVAGLPAIAGSHPRSARVPEECGPLALGNFQMGKADAEYPYSTNRQHKSVHLEASKKMAAQTRARWTMRETDAAHQVIARGVPALGGTNGLVPVLCEK